MIYPMPSLAQSVCSLLPRLQPGQQGQVVSGGANRVRALPGKQNKLLGQLELGSVFQVLEGPVCADGYNWWHVQSNSVVGWTAEGADKEYWLSPLSESTPFSVSSIPTKTSSDASHATTTAVPSIETTPQPPGNGWLTDLAWSPDGKYLAVATSVGVRLYDMLNNKFAQDLPDVETQINDLAFSPDGTLFAAGEDGWVYAWDLTNDELKYTLHHSLPVTAIASNSDGTRIVSIDAGTRVEGEYYSRSTVHLWDTLTAKEIGSVTVQDEGGKTLLFLHDNRQVFIGGKFRQTVHRWDITSSDEKASFEAGDTLADWAVSDDGKILAYIPQQLGDGPTDQALVMINPENREIINERDIANEMDVYRIFFTPKADFLLTIDVTGKLQIRLLKTLQIQTILTNQASVVTFSPDKSLMAVGGKDGGIRLYTTPTLNSEGKVYTKAKQTLYGITGGINLIAFSSDGSRLAAIGSDATVGVWDVTSGQRKAIYKGFTPCNADYGCYVLW
jgi:WD40 repeat protein